jgi:Protein of unknown function (DUF3142)
MSSADCWDLVDGPLAQPFAWFVRACVVLALGGLCASCERYSEAPLPQEAYVWKRAWRPEVAEAMNASATYFSGWRLLVAEADVNGRWHSFTPDLKLAPVAAHAMTAVFRIDGNISLAHTKDTLGFIASFLHSDDAIRWSRVEIDYDCGTTHLADYATFLARLRETTSPDIEISITVLPAWLSSPRLWDVIAVTDESVLQVHSVLNPHQGLFDRQLAADWIQRYAKFTRKPFYVALPDYGSRVEWGEDGRLSQVVSEGAELGSDVSQEEIEADPREVAHLLDQLRKSHPSNLTGIVWFRLPVASDVRVWSLSTLESVIGGRSLTASRQAVVERDSLGAYRIIIRNVGAIDIVMPYTVLIGACPAADALSGYDVTHGATHTAFVRRERATLRAGRRAEVGWTRCALRLEEVSFED